MIRINAQNSNGYSDQGLKIRPELYFEFTKERYPDAVVEPDIGSNGICRNAADLIPHDVRIIPEILNIFTRQPEYRNFNYLELKTARRPSENCVFIYAYNEAGKLIRPWTPKPRSDNSTPAIRIPTYDIDPIYQGWSTHRNSLTVNKRASSIPILGANDMDALGEYELGGLLNPPHALMVKGVSPGKFSVSVHLRINSQLVTPDQLRLQKRDAISAFEVNVVAGSEYVDAIGITASVDGKIVFSPQRNNYYFSLKPAETVDFRAIGIRDVKTWDDEKREYRIAASMAIPFNQLEWSFLPTKKELFDSVELELPSGSGSVLRLRAKTGNGKVGELAAHGFGKNWVIDLFISDQS